MSNATATASVIKAAHAEIVGTANTVCVEAVVINIPEVVYVSQATPFIPEVVLATGYFYNYRVAPGTVDTRINNAADPLWSAFCVVN